MRMQLNGMTVPTTSTAFLAGVIIAFVNRLTPFFVFCIPTCNVVLVRFINMVFKSCFLCLLCLFSCCWMVDFRAFTRAVFSNSASFYVFRHFAFADRAFRFYAFALFAKLVEEIYFVRANPAYGARPTDFMSIRFCAGGTSNASFILSRLSHYRYLRSGFTAIRARDNRIGLTGRTHTENPAVFFTDNTQVFSHIAIIPQLPDLKGVTL